MNPFRFSRRRKAQCRDEELIHVLGLIVSRMEQIMATLDEVLKEVTDESTQLDGLSTLIDGLHQQVKDAVAQSGQVPAGVKEKIDAIFTQAESNKQKIASALDANTTGSAPSST